MPPVSERPRAKRVVGLAGKDRVLGLARLNWADATEFLILNKKPYFYR